MKFASLTYCHIFMAMDRQWTKVKMLHIACCGCILTAEGNAVTFGQ
jgi:hypothetical protein